MSEPKGLPRPAATVRPERLSMWARERRVAGLLGPLVRREIRSRYRTSALDVAWALVSPVVTMAVYGFILTQSFGVQAECSPYLVSAWSGLVLWSFFATSISTSTTSIITSASLITKVAFPREALPLAAMGSAMVDLGIGLLTVGILLFLGGVGFSAYTLLAVLPILMLVLWTAALSVFLGAIAVFARDVVHLAQLVVRVGIFATPVFYEEQLLPDALAWFYTANPVAVAIEGFRTAALCGQSPQYDLLAVQSAVAICLLTASLLYMRRVEARLADYV